MLKKEKTFLALAHAGETIANFLYKMTTAKSCCFIQDKNIDINDKTAKRKATSVFPIFRTDEPSFFGGFNYNNFPILH